MRVLNILNRIAVVAVFMFAINACTTDDLDPSLEQNKRIDGGITSVDNVYAIIKGGYSRMTSSGYYGRDYIINNEVRSDNCFSNGNSGRFTTQASFKYNENTGFFWDDAYRVIANANLVIEQDIPSLEGDEAYGYHLQGQAYAMRALAHFDLVKQFGQQHVGGTLGVPYVMKYKDEENLTPARNTVTECMNFIFDDLDQAYNLMSAGGSPEFLSKMAAKAIESNVAVYFEEWDRAIAAAQMVIDSDDYSVIPAADYVKHWGSDGSANSIFELAFSSTDNAGIDGLAYIYRTTGGGSYGDVQVLDVVEDIYDAGDVRAGILGWEGDMLRNIGKFPNNQGYDNVIVVRYEEVIMNLAEALVETGGDAATALNMIINERGIAAYVNPVTKDDILLERQREFIFEGHRYEDLVRMGKDIEKISIQQNFSETIPYGDPIMAWAIPKAETDANSNMVQNDGY
ncbi:RagB/SusD family nutrient uptake outer membrane protein [Carboxylicivirga sp. M1479]|uniref:RagB/SusD family nutrient uptake outer membrane protein n=1 Tax=Carboxylicivirga sp. M1479 TaxID=2594476 RepID=UPI001178431E|nr:RagB/SusD family nutrient uptake outer membrane protein [Carboxylicivirga sp. M1479]TRX70991.1 RagB/SusD family nutrient uptake outer membrane protein [Carboxylicivirga sp. M1479]